MVLILNICCEYGIQCNIKFNPKQNNMLVIRPKHDTNVNFPILYLNDEIFFIFNKDPEDFKCMF